MKQDKIKGCLKPSYVLGPALWPVSEEGGCSEGGRGAKDIKSKTRTILVIINTQYTGPLAGSFENKGFLKGYFW